MWLKPRRANILASLTWTYPTQGMWKKKVTPSSVWTSKCVCWKEGEVPFAHPCLLSASFRRTLHYWEPDLWSAEPTFQLEEVCKDTLGHTKGLTPKKKPAAGLEGWFYYLIMKVLHTKEASTVEDTNGFTKSTLKTARKPPAWPWGTRMLWVYSPE